MNNVAHFNFSSESLTRRGLGGRTAFEAELLSLQKEMFLYALKYDRAHAEDIVQAANEHALKAQDQFKMGTNMGAWVHTIMDRLIMDQWRRQSGRDPRGKRQFVELDERMPVENLSDPFEEIQNAARAKFLKDSIPLLSERQRQAVKVTLKMDPEHQKDIAPVMGVSGEDAKKYLDCARKAIRQRALDTAFVP